MTRSKGCSPTAPVEVSRLDEVRGFPAAIAITLGVLGAITVSFTLGATVLRRRRELGILSVLGFRPAQRRAIIVTQATSIAVAALAVGIPVGLIAGRVVWSAISGSIGLATDADLRRLQIVIGAVLLVIGFNVIAATPTWGCGPPPGRRQPAASNSAHSPYAACDPDLDAGRTRASR